MDKEKDKIKTSIGGQALVEGIMMRGPKKTAMAVRKPNGEIELEVDDTIFSKSKIKKAPVIRGIFVFAESMIAGYKALMRSAELAFPEELRADAGGKNEETSAVTDNMSAVNVGNNAAEESENSTSEIVGSGTEAAETVENDAASVTDNAASEKTDTVICNENTPAAETEGKNTDNTSNTDKKDVVKGKKEKKKKDDGTITDGEITAVMIIGIVLGFALAIFLFKFLPEGAYGLLARLVPGLKGNSYGHSLIRAVITGLVKIIILVGYMAAVSLMKDIRRTFMYHGAEHKSIFCYEKGLELTVENVRAQSRLHPRCGTSFLVLSVLVSIFVNMFIPNELVASGGFLNTLARTGVGLLLLPVTMGLGYELIKMAGKHDNKFTRIISAPGMWLQHITTKEPTPDMIECAIAALKEVIPNDGSDRI